MGKNSPGQPRRRGLRYLFFAFLGILVILAIIFVALVIFFPRERVKTFILNQMSRRLGSQTQVYSGAIYYSPPSSIVIEDLVVTDPQTSVREFEAKQVVFHVNPWYVFSQGKRARSIEIYSPVVNVWKTAEGKWNVEKLVRKPPEGQTVADEAPFGPIIIHAGRISLLKPREKQLLTIHDLDATVRLRTDTILIDAATLVFPPVRADFDGSVSQFSTGNPLVNLKISGKLLKQGLLAGLGGEKLSKDAEITSFAAQGRGPTDKLQIDGRYSIQKSLTFDVAAEGTFNCILHGDQELLELNAAEAKWGDSTLSLAGLVRNLWSAQREAQLSGKAHVLVGPVIRVASDTLADKLQAEGAADGDISLTATMKDIGIKSDLNIGDVAMSIPKLMQKPQGMPGTLAIDGQYVMPRTLILNKYTLTLQNATVSGSGKLDPSAQPWAQATAQTADFPLPILDQLPKVNFPLGNLTLDAQISQQVHKSKQIDYQGTASIKNAELLASALSEPIRDLNATVKVAGQNVTVEDSQFTFAEGQYKADGRLQGFSAPDVEGTVSTNRLNVKQVLASIHRGQPDRRKQQTNQGESTKTGLPSGMTLKLLINADSVYVPNLLTGAMSGTLQASGEMYSFGPFTVKSFGGELRGNSQIAPTGQDFVWTADVDGMNLSIPELLKQVNAKTEMTGSLNTKVKIQGTAPGNTQEILRSLNGTTEMTAKNGKLVKFPALTAIINLFQVPVGGLLVPGLGQAIIANTVINFFQTSGRSLDISSVEYTDIKGSFALSQGIAKTDDLRFNSGIIDLIARGDYNYLDKTVDMRVKATPLGALASMIGKVPIVGGVIKGAKEAVVSTDFAVTGTLSNPDVKPLLLGSYVGGGEDPPSEMKNRETAPKE